MTGPLGPGTSGTAGNSGHPAPASSSPTPAARLYANPGTVYGTGMLQLPAPARRARPAPGAPAAPQQQQRTQQTLPAPSSAGHVTHVTFGASLLGAPAPPLHLQQLAAAAAGVHSLQQPYQSVHHALPPVGGMPAAPVPAAKAPPKPRAAPKRKDDDFDGSCLVAFCLAASPAPCRPCSCLDLPPRFSHHPPSRRLH